MSAPFEKGYKLACEIAQRPFFIKHNYLWCKSLSFNYVRYRVMRPILKGIYKSYRKSIKNSPWTSPASIAFFDKYLTQEMTGLEYGSGFSTVFFANRLNKLISIEHHEEWHSKISKELEKEGVTGVSYLHIPQNDPDEAPEVSPVLDRFPVLNRFSFSHLPQYFNYYEHVLTYPDEHFDFILVDGRARVECCLNSLAKLKRGGVIALDNAERPRYKPVHEVLKDWPKVFTTNGLTDTVLWFKP